LAQGQITVLVSLAIDDMDDHAWLSMWAILSRASSERRIRFRKYHQQSALKQTAAGVDQTCDFFLAENVGQLPPRLGIGQVLAELMTMKRAHEEEAQCSHMVSTVPGPSLRS